MLSPPSRDAFAPAVKSLTENGTIARILPEFEGYPAVRLTIGTDDDMQAVFAALKI